jgi:uncharacterized Zn-binding protein involved in type VI secretion
VLVNNALAVVEGGTYEVIPPHPHPGSAASSATVFIEGKPVHRNGDAISCGDTASNGSHDVFAG